MDLASGLNGSRDLNKVLSLSLFLSLFLSSPLFPVPFFFCLLSPSILYLLAAFLCVDTVFLTADKLSLGNAREGNC